MGNIFSPVFDLVVIFSINGSFKRFIVFILIIMICSDTLYSILYGYPIFGNWTFFNYTGFLMMGVIPRMMRLKEIISSKFIGVTMLASLSFWVWTNFGVWMTSGMYPHDSFGFITCYQMALPYLYSSFFATLLFGLFFMLLVKGRSLLLLY